MKNLILTITLFLSCIYAQKKTTEQYLDGRNYKILHQTIFFENGEVSRTDLSQRNTLFKYKVLGTDRVQAMFNIGDHSGFFVLDLAMSNFYKDDVQYTNFHFFQSYFKGNKDSAVATMITAFVFRDKKVVFMFTQQSITTVFELEFVKMERN